MNHMPALPTEAYKGLIPWDWSSRFLLRYQVIPHIEPLPKQSVLLFVNLYIGILPFNLRGKRKNEISGKAFLKA